MIILNKEAILFLNKELALLSTGKEQDWDIELADFKRVDEFILYYESSNLDKQIKIALASLILASLEDLFQEKGISFSKWQRTKNLLQKDYCILEPIIKYWKLEYDNNSNNLFTITPFLRELKKP